MQREIVGFHQDSEGHWVADLACLHSQHLRHQPPFRDVAWVLDPAEREKRVGTGLDCPLCDRAELPTGLGTVRTAGPFDVESLPAGLRQRHTVAPGRWGLLRAVHGPVAIEIEVEPPIRRQLASGESQAIPPEVPHRVTLSRDAEIEIDFLLRDPSVDGESPGQ